MGQYFSTRQKAEDFIASCQNAPVFFARILDSGAENWMCEFRDRDYSNAAFTILEDLSAEIASIRRRDKPL